MTEQKQPEDNVQRNANTPAMPKSVSPEEIRPKNTNKSKVASAKKANITAGKIPTSKIGVFSLLVAISACAASGGLYYWFTQQQLVQQEQTRQALVQLEKNNLAANQTQTSSLLKAQQRQLSQEFSQEITRLRSETQNTVAQLNSTVNKLQQQQPSDWLLMEAEYLIRIAARTLWLEQETAGAINLLADADNRLKELSNPELLPVRQLIFQDIETLKLLPVLEKEETILSLMGLSQQISSLVLTLPYRDQSNEVAEDLTLTKDPGDWRSNLGKLWQKFRADFIITSRKRTESDTPLLSPQFQQNLHENLDLKLQLAIWSASKGEVAIFEQTLKDIQLWLANYYDREDETNLRFIARIEKLTSSTITVSYPNKLASLAAIRAVLSDKAPATVVVGFSSEESSKGSGKVTSEGNSKVSDEVQASEQLNIPEKEIPKNELPASLQTPLAEPKKDIAIKEKDEL